MHHETTPSAKTDEPLKRYRGIWRENGPRTLEGIIAEQREMRGWDEYDHWIADGDASDAAPAPTVPSRLQPTSWPQALSRDFNPGKPAPR
jgi:hypothetical protein